MHHLADRAIEQLSFDLQVEVASAMGYHDSRDQRAVEIFMQDYFRHATRVGDLTRIFLTSLEAVHAKDEPLLERIFKRKPKIDNNYIVIHNRLAIKSEKEFLTNPINLLNFVEILEEELKISAIKELTPIQQGDVIETFADIEKLKNWINYTPKTSLKEGIKKFAEWYIEFYK